MCDNEEEGIVRRNKYGEDEVSFIQIFLLLWSKKSIILIFVLVAVCVAYYKVHSTAIEYEVSSVYSAPSSSQAALIVIEEVKGFPISSEILFKEFSNHFRSSKLKESFLDQYSPSLGFDTLSGDGLRDVISDIKITSHIISDKNKDSIIIKASGPIKELLAALVDDYVDYVTAVAKDSFSLKFNNFKAERLEVISNTEKAYLIRKNFKLDYSIALCKEALLTAKALNIIRPNDSSSSENAQSLQLNSPFLYERGIEQLSAVIESLNRQRNRIDLIPELLDIRAEKKSLESSFIQMNLISFYDENVLMSNPTVTFSPPAALIYFIASVLGFIFGVIVVFLLSILGEEK